MGTSISHAMLLLKLLCEALLEDALEARVHAIVQVGVVHAAAR